MSSSPIPLDKGCFWRMQASRQCWYILLIVLMGCMASPILAEPSPQGLEILELQTWGKKQETDDVEARIRHLEQRLHQTPLPATSLDYRIMQLYAAHQTQVSKEAQQAAIARFNEGVDKAAQKQYTEAMQAYQNAIELWPGLAPAYNNLATLLTELKQLQEAEKVYKQGLDHAPQDPLLHRNLGILYETIGQVEQAMAAYRVYLKLAKTPDPPIQAIVDNYEANQHKNTSKTDYLAFANEYGGAKALIWPRRMVPIPIYVSLQSADQAYFLPFLQEAFRQWETATQGRIRFREVPRVADANVRIHLQAGPLSHPYINVGRTQFNPSAEERKLSVTINTGEPQSALPLPERREQVSRLMLHELGHAIGIWGHSPDPGDVMYVHPLVSHLSSRDACTIQKLYGLHTDKTGAAQPSGLRKKLLGTFSKSH